VHTPQVKQQPPGTYTWKEEASRVSLVFVVPAVAYLLHTVITTYVTWADSFNQRKLQRLQESKRKMIKELKVEIIVLDFPLCTPSLRPACDACRTLHILRRPWRSSGSLTRMSRCTRP
jgi:hypothetical protein